LHFVVVEVTDGGGGGLGVLILSEAEAFWSASFAVIDEAKRDYAADRGEYFGYALFC
jgi:hypothetical protein